VTEIDFFFDPMCPWAYQASRWIRNVREQTDLQITWRFFSLEEINHVEGKKHPWERSWSWGWGQMRIGALIRRELGQEVLDNWYAGIGAAFFERAEPTHTPQTHKAALAAIDLDPAMVGRAIEDDSTTDDVKADHDFVTTTFGAFGVPTIVCEGRAVYGPVIAPAPTGAEALRLWEFTQEWFRFSNLFEMCTPKTRDAHEHIGRIFAPYLKARSWQTVQNPAP